MTGLIFTAAAAVLVIGVASLAVDLETYELLWLRLRHWRARRRASNRPIAPSVGGKVVPPTFVENQLKALRADLEERARRKQA